MRSSPVPPGTNAPPVRARRDFLKAVGAAATSIGGLALLGPRARATTQRPISDFLSKQGTTFEFTPGVGDQIGWSSSAARPPVRFALVDYAGLGYAFLKAHHVDLH